MRWLSEAHGVIGVDREVTGINVVTLEDHFENLRLVDCTLLHETYDLVLLGYCLLNVVVQLDLNFILDLTGLGEEILVFRGERKVLSILGQEMELAHMSPRVIPITHWIHRPNSHILATPQQVHPVNFPVEILPIEGEGNPGKAVRRPED